MNKIVNIFILLIFLISFIGIKVNKHYSDGKLYSVAVFAEAESCCASRVCNMDMSSCKSNEQKKETDCSCKNESEHFKLDNIFIISRFSLPEINSTKILFSTLFSDNSIKRTYNTSNNKFHYLPPPELDIDFCSNFGVFIC